MRVRAGSAPLPVLAAADRELRSMAVGPRGAVLAVLAAAVATTLVRRRHQDSD